MSPDLFDLTALGYRLNLYTVVLHGMTGSLADAIRAVVMQRQPPPINKLHEKLICIYDPTRCNLWLPRYLILSEIL